MVRACPKKPSAKADGVVTTHPELDMEKLKTLYEMVQDSGYLSVAPNLKGNELFLVVQPNKKKEKADGI